MLIAWKRWQGLIGDDELMVMTGNFVRFPGANCLMYEDIVFAEPVTGFN